MTRSTVRRTDRRKTKAIAEFGDFQTPLPLAMAATAVLQDLGLHPKSILEPTCGVGSFIIAATRCFPEASSIIGIDANGRYIEDAKRRVADNPHRAKIVLRQANFFDLDWASIFKADTDPWLILGNPPWVTSSHLSVLQSRNLPNKSNFHGRRGIEAITGKSNFDISEWMLLEYLNWLGGTSGAIAVLCKTAVARNILLQVWREQRGVSTARLYEIDALTHFAAAVDACLFVLEMNARSNLSTCEVFESLDSRLPSHKLRFFDGHIIWDTTGFERWRSLLGREDNYVWRSGVKHDCAKVMEFTATDNGYVNGYGQCVALEDNLLFPMLKSSDIANGRYQCRRSMLVTQKSIGQNTSYIRDNAPKTWDYLNQYAAILDGRNSTIYNNKHRFSIFGVGPYTFTPWKVAISGFYKTLRFAIIGPVKDRPVVFDDTVYFLSCQSEAEATFLQLLLCSEPAHEFYSSMIHWPDKRPITVDILKRLSLQRLSVLLGREREYVDFVGDAIVARSS